MSRIAVLFAFALVCCIASAQWIEFASPDMRMEGDGEDFRIPITFMTQPEDMGPANEEEVVWRPVYTEEQPQMEAEQEDYRQQQQQMEDEDDNSPLQNMLRGLVTSFLEGQEQEQGEEEMHHIRTTPRVVEIKPVVHFEGAEEEEQRAPIEIEILRQEQEQQQQEQEEEAEGPIMHIQIIRTDNLANDQGEIEHEISGDNNNNNNMIPAQLLNMLAGENCFTHFQPRIHVIRMERRVSPLAMLFHRLRSHAMDMYSQEEASAAAEAEAEAASQEYHSTMHKGHDVPESRGACSDDIHSTCAHVRHMGIMEVAYCLSKARDVLSAECKKEVEGTVAFGCASDVKNFCASASSKMELVDCIKAHTSELSSECSESIKTHWSVHHHDDEQQEEKKKNEEEPEKVAAAKKDATPKAAPAAPKEIIQNLKLATPVPNTQEPAHSLNAHYMTLVIVGCVAAASVLALAAVLVVRRSRRSKVQVKLPAVASDYILFQE